MPRLTSWGALGVLLLLLGSTGIAQAPDEIQNPSTEIRPPEIKRIESPKKKKYFVGEIIEYRIIVKMPENGEEIRLNSPNLDLENLELAGVNQETVAGAGNPAVPSEQVLNFQFTAQKPGPARINRFSLRWIYGNGALTSDFSIPPFELTISSSRKNVQYIILLSMGVILVAGAFASVLFVKRKKEKASSAVQSVSLEESVLNELQAVYEELKSGRANQSDFLANIKRIFEAYLHQKLSWNPVRVDYNELQKKLEEKWSKNEAKEIKEIFSSLDYERFSGVGVDQKKLTVLYDGIHSLIERKKEI